MVLNVHIFEIGPSQSKDTKKFLSMNLFWLSIEQNKRYLSSILEWLDSLMKFYFLLYFSLCNFYFLFYNVRGLFLHVS
jgi:hypothetical protein